MYTFPTIGCEWSGRATIGGSPGETMDQRLVRRRRQRSRDGAQLRAVPLARVGLRLGRHQVKPAEASNRATVDTMGDAVPPQHFNTAQKELIGWLNPGSAPPITRVRSSCVYMLDPYEPTGNNPKAPTVRTPSGDWYYVDYRQGFDRSTVSGNPDDQHALARRTTPAPEPHQRHGARGRTRPRPPWQRAPSQPTSTKIDTRPSRRARRASTRTRRSSAPHSSRGGRCLGSPTRKSFVWLSSRCGTAVARFQVDATVPKEADHAAAARSRPNG